MASIVSHFAVGATLALPFASLERVRESVRPAGFVITAGLLAMAPDLDTSFMGVIPYSHHLGHRGFFHSPFFAFTFAIILTTLFAVIVKGYDTRASGPLATGLALACASHGLLDAMTSAGLGVALLAPYSDQRYFMPWRPLYSPPVDWTTITSYHAKKMFLSEWPVLLIAALWSLAFWSVIKFFKARRAAKEVKFLNDFYKEIGKPGEGA